LTQNCFKEAFLTNLLNGELPCKFRGGIKCGLWFWAHYSLDVQANAYLFAEEIYKKVNTMK
jgi:hypothetical protein